MKSKRLPMRVNARSVIPGRNEGCSFEGYHIEKKNPASVLALVLLLGIGGAGGYMYLTRSKSKKTEEVIDDPDADYNEDEDDYLSSLPDDPEDFDSEIETEDDIPIEDKGDSSEEEEA